MQGSRRYIPLRPSDDQVRHLRQLLEQEESWVRRARWIRYLDDGDASDLSPIDEMTRSGRVAAHAWLVQQQHVLHARLVGGLRAPDGWIEEQPLTRALMRGV